MPTLSPAEITRFEDDGAVHVPAAIPPAVADALHALVWSGFAEAGISLADPASWRHATSRALRRIRDDALFAGINTPRLLGAIDDIVGAGRWSVPQSWGMIRVTAPSPGPAWEPTAQGWHADHHPFDDQRHALLVFIHLGTTVPGGGGTLLLTGSHRRLAWLASGLEPGKRSAKRMNSAFRRDSPWVRGLVGAGPQDRPRSTYCDEPSPPDEQGVRMRVIEAHGEPGDVWLCHACLYHAVSDNRAQRPRLMRVSTLDLDPGRGRDECGVDTPLARSVRSRLVREASGLACALGT